MTKEQIYFALPNKEGDEIKKLEQYCNKYGPDTTLKEVLNIVKKNSILCPKCCGKGYTVTEYNAYPPNLPVSGWVYQAGYDYQICDICKGYGYTEKEYKPKIKTEIIGYECEK